MNKKVKPNLKEDLNKHLDRVAKTNRSYYPNEVGLFSDSDEDWGEDWNGDSSFRWSSKDEANWVKVNNMLHAQRNQIHRGDSFDDDYDNDEEDEDEDSYFEEKFIYYYRDISQQDDVLEFNNLYEFEIFLDEEGVSLDENAIEYLTDETTIHCCINPYPLKDNGTVTLITDHSYGALYYMCSSSDNII